MAGEQIASEAILKIANDFGERLVAELRERLIEGGAHGPKVASGSLVGTMSHEVAQDSEGRTIVRLYAEDYFRFVDKGRRPGKFPPISAIREWTQTKGIEERAVFPIARKIAVEGIQPLNILNPTIDQVTQEFAPLYEKEMSKIIGVVLKNDVFSKTNTKGRIIPKSLQ